MKKMEEVKNYLVWLDIHSEYNDAYITGAYAFYDTYEKANDFVLEFGQKRILPGERLKARIYKLDPNPVFEYERQIQSAILKQYLHERTDLYTGETKESILQRTIDLKKKYNV